MSTFREQLVKGCTARKTTSNKVAELELKMITSCQRAEWLMRHWCGWRLNQLHPAESLSTAAHTWSDLIPSRDVTHLGGVLAQRQTITRRKGVKNKNYLLLYIEK
jgi:hypothetical protein